MLMDLRVLGLILLMHRICSGLQVTVPNSPETALVGSHVLLPCKFSIEGPSVNLNFLAIFWKFKDKEVLKYDSKGTDSNPRMTIDEKGIRNGDVSLSIHNVTISDEGFYECLVIYSSDKQGKVIQLHVRAAPTVKVSRKALLPNEKNRIRCSVSDFYPRDVKVTWLLDGRTVRDSDLDEPRMNADSTFSVNSSVIITPNEITKNKLIECLVEHASLENPVVDGFMVVYGAAPTVKVFWAKSEVDQGQIFVCDVRGFYPEAVTINWLLDGRRVKASTRSADGKFNKESFYQIPHSSDNRATRISCEVDHETLLNPVTETREIKNKCSRYYHYGLIPALLLPILVIGFLFYKRQSIPKFVVSDIHEPHMQGGNRMVSFTCAALNCPKEARVSWTVTDGERRHLELSDDPMGEMEEQLLGSDIYTVRTNHSEANGLHSAITVLSFTPQETRHRNTEIACKLVCDRKTKEKKTTWSYMLAKPQIPEPISLSLCDSGEVLCSAALKDFYPRGIRFTWSAGAGHHQQLHNVTNTDTRNNQMRFDAISECRVPGHMFTEPGFKVRVTWEHEALNESEYREASAADIPCRPRMGEIITSDIIDGAEAKLQCTISGYFPNALDVKWLRRERGKPDLFPVLPNETYKIPVPEVTKAGDQTYTCTAALIVKVSMKNDFGTEFVCQVGHPSLEERLERRTGELRVTGVGSVNIKNVKDHLAAEINRFYPEEIKVTWSRIKYNNYENYPDSKITNEPSENSDGTFRLVSRLYFMKALFVEKKIMVQVDHVSLGSPVKKFILCERGITEDLRHVYLINDITNERTELFPPSSAGDPGAAGADIPRRPRMEEIITSDIIDGAEAKLQCTISGYFPDALDVKWLRRERGKPDLFPVLPNETYKIPVPEVTKAGDQTYTCTAALIVKVSIRNDFGAEFVCQVGHPSLEERLERRTGELRVTGIGSVNIKYFKDHLAAEINRFYPKDIKVTWSEATITKPKITNELSENSNGTFRLVSRRYFRKAAGPGKVKKKTVEVEHVSLGSPIKKIILCEKGPIKNTRCVYLINEITNERTELFPPSSAAQPGDPGAAGADMTSTATNCPETPLAEEPETSGNTDIGTSREINEEERKDEEVNAEGEETK